MKTIVHASAMATKLAKLVILILLAEETRSYIVVKVLIHVLLNVFFVNLCTEILISFKMPFSRIETIYKVNSRVHGFRSVDDI